MAENLTTTVQKVHNGFKIVVFLISLHLVSQCRISLHHFIHEGSLIKSN
jgi:hypothetical protein